MACTGVEPRTGFFDRLFPPSEQAKARRAKKAAQRKKQRELDLQVAKDLRETGYFDDHLPDAMFYRHYYY